jgi:hypothetical protein
MDAQSPDFFKQASGDLMRNQDFRMLFKRGGIRIGEGLFMALSTSRSKLRENKVCQRFPYGQLFVDPLGSLVISSDL